MLPVLLIDGCCSSASSSLIHEDQQRTPFGCPSHGPPRLQHTTYFSSKAKTHNLRLASNRRSFLLPFRRATTLEYHFCFDVTFSTVQPSTVKDLKKVPNDDVRSSTAGFSFTCFVTSAASKTSSRPHSRLAASSSCSAMLGQVSKEVCFFRCLLGSKNNDALIPVGNLAARGVFSPVALHCQQNVIKTSQESTMTKKRIGTQQRTPNPQR